MSGDDLVIVDLADEVAELRVLVKAYRETAQEAIKQLAQGSQELEAARRRISALVAENRALRGTEAA